MQRAQRAAGLALLFVLSTVACEPRDDGTPPDSARRVGVEAGEAARDTPVPAAAGDTPGAAASSPSGIRVPSSGEGSDARVVYVPVYSHIFHSDSVGVIELAATVSVRNTDPERPIRLTSVRYFDDDGRPVREYLTEPRVLGPMASAAYVVGRRDRTGGVGANFIVEWTGDPSVTDPVVEAVMISTAAAQGISFTSRGRTLSRP